MEAGKQCRVCEEVKAPDAFYPRYRKCKACVIKTSAEWQRNNKGKALERSRKWREANPEHFRRIYRAADLKRFFGITLEDYDAMFAAQAGCCAICKRHQDSFDTALAVDHCHTTMKVRGLLCRNCNTAIGHLRDDVSLLESAITYLRVS